ncbi:hypothetical protein KQX54_011382 [Cotesia glomerata]|uniref:Uncharacterized protein n=2 Tax=Cotesia glomerata TaxID=32391 RepID=A0AAV7IHK0_COTGL|nr:hypothetical protein KQX54_011382 [Cotesia glomerata]
MAWVLHDTMIEITAYVDEVFPVRELAAFNERPAFLKFCINNSSQCRVVVTCIGDRTRIIALQLRENVVIRIERGKTIAPKFQFAPPNSGLHNMELILTPSSTINVLGMRIENISRLPLLSIRDAALENGLIRVEGWLKVPFQMNNPAHNRSASGVIVDENYRMRILIGNFLPNPLFLPGVALVVTCRFRRDLQGPSFFDVEGMNEILLNAGRPTLTMDQLRHMGFITPP